MVEEMRQFRFARQICIEDLTNLFEISEKCRIDAKYLSLFKVKYANVNSLYKDFLANHGNICKFLLTEDDAGLPSENKIRRDFLDRYDVIKATYDELFEQKPPLEVSPQAVAHGSLHSNYRLPSLTLTRFDGKIKSFQGFLDEYMALVGSDDRLQNVEKFRYLLSLVDGPALVLLKALPVSNENYNIALKTLIERYSNKRLLVKEHWGEIDNFPILKAESGEDILQLLDIFEENISALRGLGMPVDSWNYPLSLMLLKKLPVATVEKFELNYCSNEIPEYKSIRLFLEKHCLALSSIQDDRVSRSGKTPSKSANVPRIKSFLGTASQNKSSRPSCPLCKREHYLNICSSFKSKSPRERYLFVKKHQLCFLCFGGSHQIQSCKALSVCRFCQSRGHHSLLHFDFGTGSSRERDASQNSAVVQGDSDRRIGPDRSLKNGASAFTRSSMQDDAGVVLDPSGESEKPAFVENERVVVGTGLSKKFRILLGTAWVLVSDQLGRFQRLRCLIDSGSQTSLITDRALNLLGLRKTPCQTTIKGIGDATSEESTGYVALSVKPVHSDSPLLGIDALVIRKISDDLPSCSFNKGSWKHIENLRLADPTYFRAGKVDLLFGADIFAKLILSGSVSGTIGEPSALNTIFGYLLMGPIGFAADAPLSSLNFHCRTPEIFSESDLNLESQIRKFWESENIPNSVITSPEEALCETLFSETCKRDSQGKYVVSLPFKEKPLQFPGMRDLAIARFLKLERRLISQPDLYKLYREFMDEYITLNHMEPVEVDPVSSDCYYLIHHCVLRPDSQTTKLRVVFNGSGKLPSQPSLNDTLLTGPKLQQDIFSILLRFRLFKFVLCSDIRQMYRMVWVEPAHCDYQRIVWRFSSHEPLKDYRLRTITYGLNAAPYLALRCLRQLCVDEGDSFPLAKAIVTSAMYIDDCIFSSATWDIALETRNQLIALLSKAGFELRKWSSNDVSLLADLPADHLSSLPLSLDLEKPVSLKVLGLKWNPVRDVWFFEICPGDSLVCTKRVMLSHLARMYDPLGFLSPITFYAKHLIQQLWSLNLGWDVEPPGDVRRAWMKFMSELPSLTHVSFPRLAFEEGARFELVGFGDASEKGIAAVVYVRSILNDKICCSLLCSKSKVAALKRLTIPRLELDAIVLLARLVDSVLSAVGTAVHFSEIHLFSDSQIALHWMNGPPTRWKPFVANRVSYIQSHFPNFKWYYVDTKSNPADAASRGLFPSALVEFDTWVSGPSFLYELALPLRAASNQFDYPVEEERKFVLLTATQDDNILGHLLDDFSSFCTAQRVLCYLLRFIFNLKNRIQKRTGPLCSQELTDALLFFVKFEQHLYFTSELESKTLSKPLRKLNTFIDDQGVLRVGGRLQHSNLSKDAKYPILLPRSGKLTCLLIEHYHCRYFHCGPRITQYLLSQTFWILSCKRAVTSVLHKCVTCWKTRPTPFQPQMASLPASRVLQAKPFLHCGVDFGGPFLITLSRHRGIKTCKAYLCLFVCFATKAVHLELASALTTEAFLAALQRFISRRGRIGKLYCDNATNFVGASRELAVMKAAAEGEALDFCFSPPAGPHFNGLAEAGIKSVKSHLLKVVGSQILSYEEFYTTLTLIEAVLNSRPLTALSSDVDDIHVLTPGHFLTLEPLSPLPIPDVIPLPLNHLSRWQLIQSTHQQFWKRWHVEYLHTLQQRAKWLTSGQSAHVGDLVLIREDNSPPSRWSLGRILALYPGGDGIARVASVKTASGILKRPLVKLCPLPANQSS